MHACYMHDAQFACMHQDLHACIACIIICMHAQRFACMHH